jgi:hypothetical protein
MKLDLLYETTVVGAIAIKPAAFDGDGKIDIVRPRGRQRWYLAYANDSYTDGLMEKKDSTTQKETIQVGDQPKNVKTLVWQPQKTGGMTNKSLYIPKGTIESKPYGGSEMWHTNNPAKHHDEHILKPSR